MTAPSLILDGVVKRYGANLGVGPVGFEIEESEFLTLLGPSGCGKTTTLHVVAGLLFPDEGLVTLAGRDITFVEPQHRDMGLVFQNYALFPHKSVGENVAFGLRMRKVPKHQIRDRVARMLDIVGLPRVEDRLPSQLSGGQRQRVALARALVVEPTVLLLDEPLSNLDALLRKRMRLELREIQQRLGIATLFVTHDQDEAFEMSDRVVLMNQGRIEQVSAPEDLYDTPATRFAAEFIGEANLIEGRVVAANGAEVEVSTPVAERHPARAHHAGLGPGDNVYLMVRPERVVVYREAPANGAASPATVVKRVFSGDMISFTLRTGAGQEIVAKMPSLAGFRDITPQTQVWMALEECRVLPRDLG